MIAETIIFLAAAVIAVPIFKKLGLGAVLGYLAAGVAIGPYGLGLIGGEDGEEILHFGELGVVFLLFIIGLELRPSRLWALRRSIFGFGGAQLTITAIVLAGTAWLWGIEAKPALIVGLVLALSSTAFALQLIAERGEMSTHYGRSSFATLLFQDIAVVPLLALIPLLGTASDDSSSAGMQALQAAAVVLAVIFGGRYLLRFVLSAVARSGVREVLTATALLTVLGTAVLVEYAGLSMALGAFMAGVLLADSEFRHQLEADIEPFKGLLLGLFFIAVGMTLNLGLLGSQPGAIAAAVVVLVSVKFAVLFGLAKFVGLDNNSASKLGLVLSQGGEFAFVLFGIAVTAGAMPAGLAATLIVVVSLSMVTTPLLLALADWLSREEESSDEPHEPMPEETVPVLIAGFGRFGQIAARVLRAKNIPFTAVDKNHEQINFVSRYGNKVYYGDSARLDLLEAAGAGEAKILILAVDNEQQSLLTAELIREHFPNITVYARARDRHHAYELMDRGVEHIQRDTFLSALDITERVLLGLGYDAEQAARSIKRFRDHDEHRLYEHRDLHTDDEKMQDLAKEAALELEEMFERDRLEHIGD
ncbi:MAG: monovalent cation:proton antiporter-2 (CPA2) family protein [Pseudomonadaceae bacterium]|nr:monovalent cation:proton antiporter-2 (CPA2) family protein [Pseudomonadaceae bacterium]